MSADPGWSLSSGAPKARPGDRGDEVGPNAVASNKSNLPKQLRARGRMALADADLRGLAPVGFSKLRLFSESAVGVRGGPAGVKQGACVVLGSGGAIPYGTCVTCYWGHGKMTRSRPWVAVATVLAGLSSSAAVAVERSGVVSGVCHPSQVKFVGEVTERSTYSRIYVKIPGTAITFNQGGSGSTCVIVYFSATAYTATGGAMYIQAILDGAVSAFPDDLAFVQSNIFVSSHATNFFFPSVAPGPHTLWIRFLSGVGNAVVVVESNTIVNYAP